MAHSNSVAAFAPESILATRSFIRNLGKIRSVYVSMDRRDRKSDEFLANFVALLASCHMPQPRRYEFSVPIRVAWGDMDALKHVNNVSYTRYFETARAEFFVHLDERYDYAAPEGQILILTKLEVQYRGQVFFPAELEVCCGIEKLSKRTMVLGASMWNAEGRCVADGLSHHMWVDQNNGRAIQRPPEFDEIAKAYERGEV